MQYMQMLLMYKVYSVCDVEDTTSVLVYSYYFSMYFIWSFKVKYSWFNLDDYSARFELV